jgi:hypothetical protein
MPQCYVAWCVRLRVPSFLTRPVTSETHCFFFFFLPFFVVRVPWRVDEWMRACATTVNCVWKLRCKLATSRRLSHLRWQAASTKKNSKHFFFFCKRFFRSLARRWKCMKCAAMCDIANAQCKLKKKNVNLISRTSKLTSKRVWCVEQRQKKKKKKGQKKKRNPSSNKGEKRKRGSECKRFSIEIHRVQPIEIRKEIDAISSISSKVLDSAASAQNRSGSFTLSRFKSELRFNVFVVLIVYAHMTMWYIFFCSIAIVVHGCTAALSTKFFFFFFFFFFSFFTFSPSCSPFLFNLSNHMFSKLAITTSLLVATASATFPPTNLQQCANLAGQAQTDCFQQQFDQQLAADAAAAAAASKKVIDAQQKAALSDVQRNAAGLQGGSMPASRRPFFGARASSLPSSSSSSAPTAASSSARSSPTLTSSTRRRRRPPSSASSRSPPRRSTTPRTRPSATPPSTPRTMPALLFVATQFQDKNNNVVDCHQQQGSPRHRLLGQDQGHRLQL